MYTIREEVLDLSDIKQQYHWSNIFKPNSSCTPDIWKMVSHLWAWIKPILTFLNVDSLSVKAEQHADKPQLGVLRWSPPWCSVPHTVVRPGVYVFLLVVCVFLELAGHFSQRSFTFLYLGEDVRWATGSRQVGWYTSTPLRPPPEALFQLFTLSPSHTFDPSLPLFPFPVSLTQLLPWPMW